MSLGQLTFLVLAISVVSVFLATLLIVAVYEQFGGGAAATEARRRSRNAAVVHEVLRRADPAR